MVKRSRTLTAKHQFDVNTAESAVFLLSVCVWGGGNYKSIISSIQLFLLLLQLLQLFIQHIHPLYNLTAVRFLWTHVLSSYSRVMNPSVLTPLSIVPLSSVPLFLWVCSWSITEVHEPP